MRKATWLAAIGLMTLVVMGCGSADNAHEGLIQEAISEMAALNDILADITDLDSAEAAQPELQAVGERMAEIQMRMEALDEPSDTEQQRLQEKYDEAMNTEMMRMHGEISRIAQNPELAEAVGDSLDEAMDGAPQ